MAIILMPAAPARPVKHIEWTLARPAQVNRSAYSGSRTVVTSPWHGMWRARVQLVPIVGEANARAWRAFTAALKGQINTFRLPAAEGPQNGNSGVTLSANAAQNAGSCTIAGAATPLLAGQMITINDQLLMLTGISGSTLTFEPYLRAAANSGTAVETANPTCLVALATSSAGWSVDPGTQYDFSFDVEEAF